MPTGPVPSGPIPPEGLSLDAEAARLLGLARGQLYSRLKCHGLDPAGS